MHAQKNIKISEADNSSPWNEQLKERRPFSWNAIPCKPVGLCRRFGWIYCFHHPHIRQPSICLSHRSSRFIWNFGHTYETTRSGFTCSKTGIFILTNARTSNIGKRKISAIRGVDEGRLVRQLRAAESKNLRKAGQNKYSRWKKFNFICQKIRVLKIIKGNSMYVIV
jgi:hypothetical protein